MRRAISSMAAFEGAQRRIFGNGDWDAGAAFPAWIGTAGRRRLARDSETRPHIVEVFPVPGGLDK